TGMFVINRAECFRCGLCKEACAFDAVKETCDKFSIDQNYCTKCKACYNACPINAIKIRNARHLKIEEEFHIPSEGIEIIERRAKMTLGDILATKPYEIFAITQDHKVSDAIKIMNDRNVSSVLIV